MDNSFTEEEYTQKYMKYKLKYLKLLKDNKHILDKHNMTGGNKNNNKKLIAFTAKWCGHCIAFAPTWKELKNSNLKNIQLINYDSELNKDKILDYNITGFPSIYLEKQEGSQITHIEYNGNRTKSDLLKFINEN
jgi:thiol-disulfide isomerase/thioredoxin